MFTHDKICRRKKNVYRTRREIAARMKASFKQRDRTIKRTGEKGQQCVPTCHNDNGSESIKKMITKYFKGANML